MKIPGTTILAVGILTLGIGANVGMFTVIESVLLRPLRYPASSRLVHIASASGATSWLNFRDVANRSKTLENVAAYSQDLGVLQTLKASKRVAVAQVTPNLFSMLGIHALLGRAFTQAEGRHDGSKVILLSEGLWRSAFQSNPAIVGSEVEFGGKPYYIAVVMPARFVFPEEMDSDIANGVWLPLQPSDEMLRTRGFTFLEVLGRLRAGVSDAEAKREMNAIAAQMPRTDDGEPHMLQITRYRELLTGPVRPVLYGLFGALGMVLLIACANVSNLLIARCFARRQEFAVRVAIGAGRGRLLRQLLTEGALLSFAGCGIGVLLAQFALVMVRKLPASIMPRWKRSIFNGRSSWRWEPLQHSRRCCLPCSRRRWQPAPIHNRHYEAECGVRRAP